MQASRPFRILASSLALLLAAGSAARAQPGPEDATPDRGAAVGAQPRDFSMYAPLSFSRVERDPGLVGMYARYFRHPSGVAYYRLLTTFAPGMNQAIMRADVENIDTPFRLWNFAVFLRGQSGRRGRLEWRNVNLLWNDLFPDRSRSNIWLIRQLAIDLQNLDATGAWDYATLRQRVHNFPSAQIVQELEAELERARSEAVQGNEAQERRIALLDRLLREERVFWRGGRYSADDHRATLDLFEVPRADRAALNWKPSDPVATQLERVLAARLYLRHRAGVGRRSFHELMSSPDPLTQTESARLVNYLSTDRRLAAEAERLFAILPEAEAASRGPRVLRALVEHLELDGYLSLEQAQEIDELIGSLPATAEAVRRLMEEPILALQSDFQAMGRHLERVHEQIPLATVERDNQRVVATPTDRELIGPSRRVESLAEAEIRGSILFSLGAIVQRSLQSSQKPVQLAFPDPAGQRRKEASRDVELLRGSAQPLRARVVVVRDAESLEMARRRAASGEPIVLVKTFALDIELPPTALLVTADASLNRSSHMALLAESSRIPHVNFRNPAHPLFAWLLEHDGDLVRAKVDAGAARSLSLEPAAKGAESARAQRKARLPETIAESYGLPTRLERVEAAEAAIPAQAGARRRIGGGKSANLAMLLGAATADEIAALGVPPSVQVPYGYFLRWLDMVGARDEWQDLISRTMDPNHVDWARLLQTLNDAPIPPTLLDEVIEAIGGRNAVRAGWFVRSNSNSEDGKFNGAGVNLTVPDVRSAADLELALRRVFLATYRPEARAWWSRTFSNPTQVRSSAFLMSTVRSTHASVAVVSADGNACTFDSLPGLGENVVGGSAVAERLAFDLSGATPRVRALQLARAEELILWPSDGGPARAVPAQIRGAVLSESQREAAARLARVVRRIADRRPELRGVPLDLEIAWENDVPHLVQLREAPAEPELGHALSGDGGARAERRRLLREGAVRDVLALEKVRARLLGELDAAEIQPARLAELLALYVQLVRTEESSTDDAMAAFEAQGGREIVERLNARRAQALEAAMAADHVATSTLALEERLRGLFRLLPTSGQRRYSFPVRGENTPAARALVDQVVRLLETAQTSEEAGQVLRAAFANLAGDYGWSKRFWMSVVPRLSADLLIDKVLPAVVNLDLPGRNDLFSDVIPGELETLLARVFSSRDEERARQAHARLLALMERKIAGSGDKYWRRTLLDRIATQVAAVGSTPQLDYDYSRAVAELERQVGTIDVAYTTNDESPQLDVKLRAALGDYRRLRALAGFRDFFLSHVVEEERALPPQRRSVDRLAGVIRARALRDEAGPTRAAIDVLGEDPRVDAHVVLSPNLFSEVQICNGPDTCNFSRRLPFPLHELLYLPRVHVWSEKSSLQTAPRETMLAYRSQLPLPEPARVAGSAGKIAALVSYAVHVENADDLHEYLRKVLAERIAGRPAVDARDWLGLWTVTSLYLGRLSFKDGIAHPLPADVRDLLVRCVKEDQARLGIEIRAEGRSQANAVGDEPYLRNVVLLQRRLPGGGSETIGEMRLNLRERGSRSRKAHVTVFGRELDLPIYTDAEIAGGDHVIHQLIDLWSANTGGRLAELFGLEPGREACRAEFVSRYLQGIRQ